MHQKRQLIVHEQSKSPISEAYRTLRTNIQFSKVDGALKRIMLTSSGPGEGKSTTTANLAVAMAQSGKQIILLDCDLRKPVQHKVFGKFNRGLTNILVDDTPLDTLVQTEQISEYIQETEVENLRLVTSGPIPPNPSELLYSAKMQETLEYLTSQCDLLIVDAPPVIAVTDACVLASRVDGIVLVLDSTTVRPEMAQRAKELLLKADGHILGVVLNRVEIEEEYTYYYYYYGNEGKEKRRKAAL
ncbi:capsular exopolysaccharide synthesis family protein [Hydrogenispora ethanolica]|uniref:non-specific protein-tyrosine kinase n=1 Tax=Hydrogenispora ethanolica TaxID=1082276 RepID=A0A4V2QF66_HYDET|nr:polysaccharide biosynthesis tyrosine autokinase [Hydrogenispora ethanolica]TCL70777.1 capsular exopolysaccharide synthesis family protein [Hydrogenispora ethanolica]